MIVNLTADKVGDILLFGYETPLRGIKEITGLTETLIGETGTRTFKREFRIAMDGVRFGDWEELNLLNLQLATQSPNIPIKNDLLVEFRFTRIGADPTGSLTVAAIEIFGVASVTYLQVLSFEDTAFSPLAWTDEYWNKVWINLMNKLYEPGIVPEFIDRGDIPSLDDDYIDFFKANAYFFAATIALADNRIEGLIDDQGQLFDFLLQRGQFNCPDSSVGTLQKLSETIKEEYRRRGTQDITREEGLPFNTPPDPVNGELKRLICYDIDCDEFLFEYLSYINYGYIDHQSPEYGGTLDNHIQINKMPSDTADFINFDGFIALDTTIVTDGSKQVAEIAPGGILDSGNFPTEDYIKVDPRLNYEITFYARFPAGANSQLNFHCSTRDCDLQIMSTPSADGTNNNGFWFNNQTMPKDDFYYLFRGIIYSYDTPNLTADEAKMNFGGGKNLRFLDETSNFVSIEWTNVGTDVVRIWDVKMKPLFAQSQSGFIDNEDQCNIWMKNNAPNYSELDINNILERNLLPYGCKFNVNYLE